MKDNFIKDFNTLGTFFINLIKITICLLCQMRKAMARELHRCINNRAIGVTGEIHSKWTSIANVAMSRFLAKSTS